MRYRLLALDVDGTLLDPSGALGEAACRAVAEARRRGLRVVLCTGRRLRSARPVAEALGLAGPIVVNNGVLVKDLASGDTLHGEYLPPAARTEVLELLGEVASPLVYVDAPPGQVDMLIGSGRAGHPFQEEYLDANRAHARPVDDLAADPGPPVVMVSLMGDAALLRPLRESAERALAGRIRAQTLLNKNYRGQILEFVSPGSGKWSALRKLAADAGIDEAAIAAVGDDWNDLEMVERAGLGIAMGNAVPAVRAAARRRVPCNGADGVVAAVELVLSGG